MTGMFWLSYNVLFVTRHGYVHYISCTSGVMFLCSIIGMVIISASDSNTAADGAKEAVMSLPGMIPQYYNGLKVILRKDCKKSVCLTLWKLYKNDRSLIFCALGVLMNYGILIATLVQNNEILPIIDKCSSFLKLQGVLAWCVRFKKKNPLQITTGNLTVAELSTALLCLVRKVQSVYFTTEIWCIERGQQLPDSINLLTLSPFLDERKILCVGGRLRHSNLPAEQKDPMLINNNHLICDFIVKHYPFSYLHTGAKATLTNIRTKFWIVNGRSKVKRVIKQCIKCLKVSAKGKNQMVADLPSARSHSFRNCNLSIEAVLVKGEDNSKLLNWNLAKIVEVHPGTDDVTRVVTLKT
ncbi:integrase catalytic domain-containing protein, partial [Trichonephila clavata]